MNMNITKLANQSGFDIDFTGKFGNYSEMYKLEKFAELIAKDCMDICDDVTRQFGQFTFTAATAKARIAHRFGLDNKN